MANVRYVSATSVSEPHTSVTTSIITTSIVSTTTTYIITIFVILLLLMIICGWSGKVNQEPNSLINKRV